MIELKYSFDTIDPFLEFLKDIVKNQLDFLYTR